jgi:hypothetical protein
MAVINVNMDKIDAGAIVKLPEYAAGDIPKFGADGNLLDSGTAAPEDLLDGGLIETKFAGYECYAQGPFIVTFQRTGSNAVPPADTTGSGVPDYVEDMAKAFIVPWHIYKNILGILSPFDSERYDKDVDFIRIWIVNYTDDPGTTSTGRASYDIHMNGLDRYLQIQIKPDADAAQGQMPCHELAHLFQYAHTYFQNGFWLEGVARYMQSSIGVIDIVHKTYDRIHSLLTDPYELDWLHTLKYDAGAELWRPLGELFESDPVDYDANSPVIRLTFTDGAPCVKDFNFEGSQMLRKLFERLGELDDVCFAENNYPAWNSETRTSLLNLPYIDQAAREILEKSSEFAKDAADVRAALADAKKMEAALTRRTIGDFPAGTVVKLNMRGIREFIVLQQGNHSAARYGLEFNDATTLLAKDCFDVKVFADPAGNDYQMSPIHLWLNADVLDMFDEAVRNLLIECRIPYTDGPGTTGTVQDQEDGLPAKVWLPSVTEMGASSSRANVEGYAYPLVAGNLDLRKSLWRGAEYSWYTRSPDNVNDTMPWWKQTAASGFVTSSSVNARGVRPMLALPQETGVTEDMLVFGLLTPSIDALTKNSELALVRNRLEALGRSVALSQNTRLGDMPAGTSVYLKLDGTEWEFIVLQQGNHFPSRYPADFNTVTTLLMKELLPAATLNWDYPALNDYANSRIHAWLNDEFTAMFGADIQAALAQVRVPYTQGKGSESSLQQGDNGLQCKAWCLSFTECGYTSSSAYNVEGRLYPYISANPAVRQTTRRGVEDRYWFRTPMPDNDLNAWCKSVGTGSLYTSSANPYCIRPMIALPQSMYCSADGQVF